jgi:hypothetical protein
MCRYRDLYHETRVPSLLQFLLETFRSKPDSATPDVTRYMTTRT